MYERKIFSELLRHLAEKEVSVITGMRRVGKTTALRYLLDQTPHHNKLYLDLERIEGRAIFTQSNFSEIQTDLEIKGIDFSQPAVVALDEVQLVPDAVSFIKYYHDHFPVKFIISGSSSYYLRNRITESLAGRKQIFEIYPLDFQEFLTFKGIDSGALQAFRLVPYRQVLYAQFTEYYEEFIQYGGFPDVVLAGTPEKKVRLLKDVLNSYIELDVKLLSDYSAIDDLYRLVSLLASRIGSRLDYTKLASLIGISRHKVKDYMHLLERTYFLHLISPYAANTDRAIAVQPKMYLADTGLVNQLAQVSSGALFENAIALQLMRLGPLNYFQLKTGQEIDFILDRRIAAEVKETPTRSDADTLQARAATLGLEETWLIGRYPPHSAFTGFVWGGAVI
ncbi:MAG: ATP-binding protein [Bacteroidia bacterium]|nr:ATP-binding protein [Bacteroidia bacterium]